MDLTTVIGGTAAICTTAAYFPQLKKCWVTGETADFSLHMFAILSIGIGLWVVYGVMKKDWVIMQHCLDLVTPKLIFVSARYVAVLPKLNTSTSTVIEIERDYEHVLASAPSDSGVREIDPEQGLVILYTSGTTGLPKGALVSHRAEIARMTVRRMDLQVTGEDAFVAWAPMFHMGSTDQMLAALMSGAPVIDGFNAESIVDGKIQRHEVEKWVSAT